MNELSVFNFDEYAIRTVIGADGEPWFVAADLLDALTLDRKALERLDDDEKGVNSIHTLGGDQQMTVINESGLYSLILTSRKPEAKRFKKWITSEVLPSIRKTGSYSKPQTTLEILQLALQAEQARLHSEAMLQIALATKAEIGSRREATAMNTASQAVKKVERLQIALDTSKSYATIKRMEMACHGAKFAWKKLKDASFDVGVPPIDVFDANYGTVKCYHAEAWMEAYAIDISEFTQD